MRRHKFLIAVPICAAALGVAPAAAWADLIPAPPAAASGVAAQVGSLLERALQSVFQADGRNGGVRNRIGKFVLAVRGEARHPRKIHLLLTDHQKELEKAMQQREHNGGENRRSGPAAASSEARPSWAS